MKTLGNTISNVVREMNPTVICMCEVGGEKSPLTEEEMQQVADQSIHAWKEAATEHFELRSMFEVGAPYMTIYKDGPIQMFMPSHSQEPLLCTRAATHSASVPVLWAR